MLDLFSTREIAIGIWTGIIFILIFISAVKSTSIRLSIYDVIRMSINKYFIIFFLIIIGYSAIWIKLLFTFSLWDWRYIKDIIFSVLFVGVPICFNAVPAKRESYFSDVVKSNFKIIILLEFLIGTFTFSLIAELILVPIATLLVLFNAVATTDKAYKSVEKLLTFLQVIFGYTVLFYAAKKAVQHYVDLNSIDLFITFSIPIITTIIFVPLAYLYAIYAEYEILFKMAKFRIPQKKQIRSKVSWKLIKVCKLSLKRVHLFKRSYFAKLYTTMSEEELDRIIDRFRLSFKE